MFLVACLAGIPLPASASPSGAPRRVIVTFAPSGAAATKCDLRRAGAIELTALPSAGAAAMVLPSGLSIDDVRQMPGVIAVEDDIIVTASRIAVAPQVLPWGVDRVEADLVWGTTTGDPIKVAVVDTGIDTTHPDLTANLKGGYSAVKYTRSYNDDNGHGTHVAGTIAAANNSLGVVGVAPKADLYAIKVLDRAGTGYLSDIIKGIDWAVSSKVNVINMSLGTSSYSPTFEAACRRATLAGITIVAAAGNAGPGLSTVGYPARFADVIGVSASDSTNMLASFSSRGPEVDVAAPGVSINSTYKNKTYATLSGTSMASPHVAGIAALVLTTPVASDDLDGDRVWDPAEVQNRITRTAQDMGGIGYDTDFGWGLARADLAVMAR